MAVLKMNPPALWSFFFFFMLICLALSSICGGVQTFLAFILDEKPEWTGKRIYIVVGSCFFFFLCGVPMCTTGGIHLFQIFDQRCTSSLLLLCFVEMALVAWVYGYQKFLGNIEEMGIQLSKPIRSMWIVLWCAVCPIIILFIVVLKWVSYKPMKFNDDYEYPAGVQAVGWIFELLPTAITVGYFFFSLYKNGIHESFNPSPSWELTNASLALRLKKTKDNEAFFDETVYKVTASPKKEKMTEL
ncbi:sodium-dependent dopamine transporter [Eurytemora carolleeae]|uniref:sodium-dependent dopamine transporter n=1 Tax=Eurytemora carolleeae TaxID=1294199 RepID=UPI000C770101|nr:sodium-dependent dopamine transporter [Eurytemora carolleeae]|eukprot:XP_023324598.1 sodium-dependent dopamine transporter-like [Eurytemora affinis]